MSKNFLILLLAIALAGMAFGARKASAIEVEFGGFVKNQIGVWLDKDPEYGRDGRSAGDLEINRTTLQLETLFRLRPDLRLFSIVRAVKEPHYKGEVTGAYDPTNPFATFSAVDAPDDRYEEFDFEECMRELYLDMDLSPTFNLRIGKQQVVWGESDNFRMMDIINPLDLSWSPISESWKDVRIPLWMVKGNWLVPRLDANIEAFWIPGFDDQRVNKTPFDYVGGKWFPTIPPGITGTGTLASRWGMTSWMFDLIPNNVPKKNIEHSQFGARWLQTKRGVTYGLSAITMFFHDPVIAPHWAPSAEYPLGISREYPRQNVFGASADWYWDRLKTVFRVEGGYFPDVTYHTGYPLAGGAMNLPLMEKDVIKYMIGFDRPTIIRWINPNRSTFITGQAFHTWVLSFDDDDTLVTAFYPIPIHECAQMYTLGFSTGYRHDTILPTIFLGYDPRGNGMLLASCDFIPAWNENMKFKLLLVTFDANDEYEGLGLFERKDYIRLESTFSW